jgi:hypothetical protein
MAGATGSQRVRGVASRGVCDSASPAARRILVRPVREVLRRTDIHDHREGSNVTAWELLQRMSSMATGAYLAIAAGVLLLLIICWILLPFILLSTNRHVRRLLREQEKTNALLESMARPRESRETPESLPSVRLEPGSRVTNKKASRP